MCSNENSGPNFLGIGPEKTGTSWIYSRLNKHPEVALTPLKELRYFWEHYHYPEETIWHRLIKSRSWHLNQYHEYFFERLSSYLRNPQTVFSDPQRVSWDYRYLFSKHSDNWYLSCFSDDNTLLRGEISPQYFFLPDKAISHIRHVLPESAKILISLRNPVDWVWSFARMMLRTNTIKEGDDEALTAFFNKKMGYSQFSPAIKRWMKYFPPDQLQIVYYDELVEHPDLFYKRITDFLGISSQEISLRRLQVRVNKGFHLDIPKQTRDRLYLAWEKDIKELSKILPDTPKHWSTPVV